MSHRLPARIICRRIRPWTCVSLIKQCGNLKALKSVHGAMVTSNFHSNLFFATNLVSQFASLGYISYAYNIFTESKATTFCDIFSWNVMIRGFVDNGLYKNSIDLYFQMHDSGILPDNFTFPFALKACAFLGDLASGVRMHHDMMVLGYEMDVFAANSLISMYGKCGQFCSSRKVFDEMFERNLISWNSMIGAYAHNSCYREGMSLFSQLLLVEKTKPDHSTILNVMECVDTEDEANDVYKVVLDNTLDLDQRVQNSAMGMYARCGRVDITRKIFDDTPRKDIMCWTSIIEAYARADFSFEAFKLFKRMKQQGIFPDSVTILSIIRACGVSPSLRQAGMIHGFIVTRHTRKDQVALETALVDLYIKCGSIDYARKVFDRMQEKNLITWSAIISGYGIHGNGREALSLFDQMKISVKPDHIIFVSVLSACSHHGLIDEGWECFNSMTSDYGITPMTEHYACMVDLLSRAGRLTEALEFIETMPITPDASVWGALLGACRIHSNVELAEKAATSLIDLDSSNPGRYILLCNIYTSLGRTKEADQIRDLMRQRGLKKVVGHTNIT